MDNKGIKMKDNEGNNFFPCPYYPIGSIYLSVNNINPSEYFGGDWEQIKDVFLLACSTKYTAGSTGGEETHKLTVEEMPSHNHSVYYGMDGASPGNTLTASSNSIGQSNGAITNRGGNQPHNNMPPYLAVYMWKRVA